MRQFYVIIHLRRGLRALQNRGLVLLISFNPKPRPQLKPTQQVTLKVNFNA